MAKQGYNFDEEALKKAKEKMSVCDPGSWADQKSRAEFLYHQTMLQKDVADYAKK